jgi:hypothetical protein
MHICYRLKVPQVCLSDIHKELCIRTFFSLFFYLLSYPNGQLCDNFIVFLVDYDNLKFTLLISASSRTFSRRQSAAIELFTAATTFSVLIHLRSQVRGVLARTLVEY